MGLIAAGAGIDLRCNPPRHITRWDALEVEISTSGKVASNRACALRRHQSLRVHKFQNEVFSSVKATCSDV
eukprot:376411-Amphidinium_carterae.2